MVYGNCEKSAHYKAFPAEDYLPFPHQKRSIGKSPCKLLKISQTKKAVRMNGFSIFCQDKLHGLTGLTAENRSRT